MSNGQATAAFGAAEARPVEGALGAETGERCADSTIMHVRQAVELNRALRVYDADYVFNEALDFLHLRRVPGRVAAIIS